MNKNKLVESENRIYCGCGGRSGESRIRYWRGGGEKKNPSEVMTTTLVARKATAGDVA